MGPFKAWLRWEDDRDPQRQQHDHQEAAMRIHDSVKAAMDEDDELGGTGEWIGLLGFSQGAKVCGSLLFSQQRCAQMPGEQSPKLPRFRFAILLAGRGPLVWLGLGSDMPTGVVGATTSSTALHIGLPPIPLADRLHIPTLHVHGLRDPGLSRHQELLYRCCDTATSQLLEWDGAHQVPTKSVDVLALAKEILVLARKTVDNEFSDGVQRYTRYFSASSILWKFNMIQFSCLAIAVVGLGLALLVVLVRGFQNEFRRVPGPWYTLFADLVLKISVITGRRMYYVDSLDKKYGPYVRMGPNEVAVNDPVGFVQIHKIPKFKKSECQTPSLRKAILEDIPFVSSLLPLRSA
ncbi:hypothetical protein DV737_g5768, partial [Chaetothyriales sp. CBS 132003]